MLPILCRLAAGFFFVVLFFFVVCELPIFMPGMFCMLSCAVPTTDKRDRKMRIINKRELLLNCMLPPAKPKKIVLRSDLSLSTFAQTYACTGVRRLFRRDLNAEGAD